jgi:hypothetical protein
LRPDGIAFKMPTKTKTGVICLLEFKSMSDVTSHYIVRVKRVTEAQYASLRSTLAITMQRQGWRVEQVRMKIFDEYTNILKGMHSIRCNGRSDHGGTSVRPVHGRSDHGDAPT